jgi:hypothetical protein
MIEVAPGLRNWLLLSNRALPSYTYPPLGCQGIFSENLGLSDGGKSRDEVNWGDTSEGDW